MDQFDIYGHLSIYHFLLNHLLVLNEVEVLFNYFVDLVIIQAEGYHGTLCMELVNWRCQKLSLLSTWL